MLSLALLKLSVLLLTYVALVAFGNVTDYWTNFAFVTHVLDIDHSPAESSHPLARANIAHPPSRNLSLNYWDRDHDRGLSSQRRPRYGEAAQG